MYAKYFKRTFDLVLSIIGIIVLFPFLLVLVIFGVIFMRGNPFFTQERAGKNGKEFKMIKLRTMDNRKDEKGKLLPDEKRINKYGRFLRSTSLDELPELFNIIKGDMSIVGPRPLLVDYLPYYTENEMDRHNVRPGLTGLAQIKGRNFLTWEEIFEYDIEYVESCSMLLDVYIILQTAKKVLLRKEIADVQTIMIDRDGNSWVVDNGEKKRLHKPLDEERKKKC